MIRFSIAVLAFTASSILAQDNGILGDDLGWVNIRDVAPTIAIELRYATSNNIAHRPLYPFNMQPMIRAGVAHRLIEVQAILRRRQYGLKIWDAYRPRELHAQLWRFVPKNDYVANPNDATSSMHTCFYANRFRRFHPSRHVALHRQRSADPNASPSFAIGHGSGGLLWTSDGMVAFHGE